ncbi:MAG: hypothetical protein JWR90_3224 [Marmoricola sp.]|jgi:hypothetical protein|nr:hypothetical protein [Marmoricola sp.]
MFGSQALETAIGLAAMFFIIATAASSITEFISRVLNKRARDLEKSIAALLEGDKLEKLIEGKKGKTARAEVSKAIDWIKKTSVWQSAAASSGKTLWKRHPKGPSYLSAKLFADAVAELLTQHKLIAAVAPPAQGEGDSPATAVPVSTAPAVADGEPTWPENLKKRLDAMVAEGRTDLISLKAGIETWFDESMGRAEGAYKRWATLILFVVGLFLAVSLNLSTISTASALWRDPVTREAVANSATALTKNDDTTAAHIKSVADAANKVDSLGIPGGWNTSHKAVWFGSNTVHVDFMTVTTARLSDLAGWFLTAVLVMLGAPFWFDLLGKLVSIRGAGAKPVTAAKDDSSATTTAAATTTTTTTADPANPSAKTTVATTGEVTPAGPATPSFAKLVGLIP